MNGQPLVSVGFPGLIVLLSGTNADGLAQAVLEVFQSRPFAGGGARWASRSPSGRG